jgi:N-methylhydantoinase B
MAIDPTRLAILARGLRAIADEMVLNLVRSAFSTVVREARDCSTAILDVKGCVVAQAEMIPIQTAALSVSFQNAAEQLDLPARATPDSVVIMNDPYSGGQHLNDVIIFHPIFFGDRLLGWSGSTAHHLDIGGATAGVNTQATELIQEGLIIPPLLMDAGIDWHGGAIEKLILANIRTAEIGLGDFNAQFAANHVGRERILEMARREGPDAVSAAMEAALEYSERRMRAAIAALPDGTWQGEAFLDRDTFDDRPVRFFVTVTVAGDEMTLDFTGSSPQLKGMFNCTAAAARASAVTAVRSVLADLDIPANDGCDRPLTLIMPEGSVLNPRRGAPVRARNAAGLRTLDAVHAALAKAIPDRVPSQGFNTTTGFYITKPLGDGTSRIYLDVFGGGFGAARNYDGCHATDNILSSCRITPVESIEQIHPHLRISKFALVPDSGGAGEFMGGLGFVRGIEVGEDGMFLNLYSDHHILPPKGFNGGHDGGRGNLRVQRGGETIQLTATSTFNLRKGDVIELTAGGGAGWGGPGKRSRAEVEADLANGFISQDAARRLYGWTGQAAG